MLKLGPFTAVPLEIGTGEQPTTLLFARRAGSVAGGALAPPPTHPTHTHTHFFAFKGFFLAYR